MSYTMTGGAIGIQAAAQELANLMESESRCIDTMHTSPRHTSAWWLASGRVKGFCEAIKILNGYEAFYDIEGKAYAIFHGRAS